MRSIPFILACSLMASPAFAADPVGELDAAESSRGSSQRGPFGLGLMLGEPSAITAKFMLAPHSGIQIHVGYGIGRRGRFILIGDYLFHFPTLIAPIKGAGRLVPYIGVGGRLGIHTGDPYFGVRIPLGLAFWLAAAPIEFFIEVAPGLGILPSTVGLIDGGLGGRFYF